MYVPADNLPASGDEVRVLVLIEDKVLDARHHDCLVQGQLMI